ncbi:SR-related and CTD-associated factor 4-like [Maniola jurtina]|uniref:SR-related and CTD-associated factor 4-like n=1 Tax=Maniola jurtina TaxID=191418 RepID=UPI001E68BEE6|nr:SR-related and CTD-associated factor 4-like [Maniola jurtina]
MKVSVICLALCACVWAAAADVAHIKGAKSRIISRLAGKHHKRGILSGVPPFKLGHDIPYVTHSVVKPLVVTYPPTASVAAVKVPVSGSHFPRYPVPVGHKVPGLPHPHYALKFPHHRYAAKPDHHFHHHHHHVAPRPLVPVVPAPPVAHAAPVIPAPSPTVAVVNAAPPPPPVFPAQLPVPAPPVPVIPDHFHLKHFLPAATAPLPPPPALPAPLLPLHQPFPYIIRPGGAVQTSFFATYPRYPLLNSYQAPLIPFAPAAPALPAPTQVLLERPHLHPYHLVPQAAAAHGVVEQHTPNVVVEQTPAHFHSTQLVPQPHVHVHPAQEALPQPGFHLHSTQAVPQGIPLHPTQPSVSVEHDGWSPVAPAQPHDLATSHEAHYPHHHHHFTQEQGTQVYEHHTENEQHDYQHQLHHIQQQIEQAQYEQSLHNQQQQPAPEYGVPQQEYGQPNEYSQQGQDFGQHQQDFAHAQEFVQQGHDFAHHAQDFAHNAQDYAHNAQDFAQHGQDFSQHGQDFSQNGQDFNQNNYNVAHLGQEYGVPHQGVEGRSSEDSAEQQPQFHNHIPLGLQPPIDRPLDHFQ